MEAFNVVAENEYGRFECVDQGGVAGVLYGYKAGKEEASVKEICRVDRAAIVASNYLAQWEKQAKAVKPKAERSTPANPYKVGDVLVKLFGYDETHLNFFQVVEVKSASVVLIEIKQEVKLDADFRFLGNMPLVDQFCGDPIMKRVSNLGWSKWDGQPVYCTY